MTHRKSLTCIASILAVAGMVTLRSYSVSHTEHEPVASEVEVLLQHKAVAVISSVEEQKIKGTVKFQQLDVGGVRIEAKLSGLTPGKHGIHIHEFGDLSEPIGSATGDHFDPDSSEHGSPSGTSRHTGDLGNLEADESGNVTWEHVDIMLTLNGPLSIIGRAVVIHAEEDDLTSQPSGDAGDPVAAGVIGIAE